MSRQYSSTTYAAAPAASRYSNSHGTSSAFSESANPNEDWTKISDLAERRRIQNRIAQRNYRRKLKRRLEDLERRAASPPQTPTEVNKAYSSHSQSQSSDDNQSLPGNALPVVVEPCVRKPSSPAPLQAGHQYRQSYDDRNSMFSHQYTRQLSTSPPPFSYSYPADSAVFVSYPQHLGYQAMSLTASDLSAHANYLAPLASSPNVLPSTEPYIKEEPFFADEEMLSPFSTSYALMAGMDIPTTRPYFEANMNTPPLSQSFDPSVAPSPSESSIAFPTTPGSSPGSPLLFVM